MDTVFLKPYNYESNNFVLAALLPPAILETI